MGGGGGSGGGGGLGAGKPKAFLAFMTSATKKQPAKKPLTTPKGGGGGGRGQGNKNKTPLSGGSKKGGEVKGGEQQTPSRTSNRSIKRPRTYDEDLEDLKTLKSSTKKAKGTPKVSVFLRT